MQVPLNTIGVFYCPKRASLRTFLSAARVALKILKTNDELYFRHCVCHFRQIFQVQYVFAPKNCGATTFLDEKESLSAWLTLSSVWVFCSKGIHEGNQSNEPKTEKHFVLLPATRASCRWECYDAQMTFELLFLWVHKNNFHKTWNGLIIWWTFISVKWWRYIKRNCAIWLLFLLVSLWFVSNYSVYRNNNKKRPFTRSGFDKSHCQKGLF